MNQPPFYMVFDVESIGIHGEAFAIAGGIFTPNGKLVQDGAKFCFACDPYLCEGAPDDRKWVSENVPKLEATHDSPLEMRDAFWRNWLMAKADFPGVVLAAECAWPVEARLLIQCVDDSPIDRKWDGPYPLHDIASIMLAKGMDPMATYERTEECKPAHHPLMDVMHSAQLLAKALSFIWVLCFCSCVDVTTPSRARVRSLGGKVAYSGHGEKVLTDHDAAFAVGAQAVSDLASAAIVGSVTKAIQHSQDAVKASADANATRVARDKIAADAAAAQAKTAAQQSTTNAAIKGGAPLGQVNVNPP